MKGHGQGVTNEQATATILAVEGITCSSCIGHVSSTLNELEGVNTVEVKLNDGIVIVEHDVPQAPVARLITALNEAGYPSTHRHA